jgi:hypothetical protein
MVLSNTERAAINRKNAQKSTGPRTPEGKARSAQNAVRHGLCAKAIPLPNEDPRIADERHRFWLDYYQPVSPAAVHLTTECARATLWADRLHRSACAHATTQIYEAHAAVDRRRGVDIQAAKDGIDAKYDPGPSLKALAATGAGCRAMLERWVWYLSRLRYDEATIPDSGTELLRMLGHPPGAVLKHDPNGWVVHLLQALAMNDGPDDRDALLEALFDPAQMPDELMGQYHRDALPDRDTATAELSALIESKLAWWAACEEAHRVDVPPRTRAADRALLPKDPVAARLLVRYQSEARIAFQQAYKALLLTLAYDAEHPSEGPEEAPEEGVPGPSRNEANPAGSASEPVREEGVQRRPPPPKRPAPAAPTALPTCQTFRRTGAGPQADPKPRK